MVVFDRGSSSSGLTLGRGSSVVIVTGRWRQRWNVFASVNNGNVVVCVMDVGRGLPRLESELLAGRAGCDPR